MKASRSHDGRVIQYHATNLTFDGAVALRRQILRYIHGIKGPRENPVTRKQIVEWFRATDPAFVEKQINYLSDTLKIRGLANSLGSHRRFNGRYVYELTEAGERELGITREDTDDHEQELAGIRSLAGRI